MHSKGIVETPNDSIFRKRCSRGLMKISKTFQWDSIIENINFQEKNKEIWLSPMTNAPTPAEKSKKQHGNIKKRHQNFDNTTIADRLRTVS